MTGDGSDQTYPDRELDAAIGDLERRQAFEDADAFAGGDESETAAATGTTRSAFDEQRLAALEADRLAAEAEGDVATEARVLGKLAALHERLGSPDLAREAHSRARFLFEMGGDGAAAAGAVMKLGDMESRLRRSEGAARLYHEAADLFMRARDAEASADALLSEADMWARLGRQDAALDRIGAAWTLFSQLDHTLGQAHTAYRRAMVMLAESPDGALDQLDLAARLFGDHVSRDVDQIDVALPETVSDSRRYPPFVMQRICLRERQKLSGGSRASQVASRSGARRMRGESESVATADNTASLTMWIGLVLLVGGLLAFTGPQLAAENGPLALLANALGGVVSAATLLHMSIGACGAVAAMVAARQAGIGAPVVLLALAIGIGMIFHEVGRAVFPGPTALESSAPSAAALAENEASRLARAEGASHLRDGRGAAADGQVEAARESFERAYRVARDNVDAKGRISALEELLALELERGAAADQLGAAERLADDLRGVDETRRSEVLEQMVVLSERLDDRTRLRDAHAKLLAHHEREGNTTGEVSALIALAAIDRDDGDLEGAYEWYRRAHAGYELLRDAQGQIGTLLAMGEIDARLGRRRRAYGRYYHAFAMYREIDDTAGQAAMLLHMGTIDEASERYEEASAAFRQAERLYADVGDTSGQALAALRFGATQVAHGNQRQAREGFLRSLELYRARGDVGGQARAHLGLGSHWLKVGNPQEASRHYELARALYQRSADATGQLAALREMAIIAHESGSAAIAGSRLEEARRVTRDVVDPGIRAGLLLSAGDLALSLERPEVARNTYREALALYESLGDGPGRRAADQRLSRLQSAG